MLIASTVPEFPRKRLRRILAGLPRAKGYRLEVKPLRYRTSPHLAALCDAFRFRWFYRNIVFRTKTEVIRFLYCHEYYHYYLFEVLGRKGSAETACDRFALEHFRARATDGPDGPAGSARRAPPTSSGRGSGRP